MACTRRGWPAEARPGAAGSKDDQPVLYAEPTEVLKPLTATGNSARDRVAQWIWMRAAEPGITTAEVARRLGILPETLYRLLSEARKEGWLVIEDPLTKVQVEILPKVVENINGFLDAKDKQVTIEAMKGFLVPLWKDQQGIEEGNKVQVLGIKIEMPPGGDVQARGQIHGTPRKAGAVHELPPVIDATFTSDPDQ